MKDYSDAVRLYKRAHVLRPEDQATTSELGVVYALRASAEQRDLDWGTALEYGAAAVGKESGAASSHHNLALMTEAIPLPGVAAEEWQTVLTSERDSRWRDFAEWHLAELRRAEERRARLIESVQVRRMLSPESLSLPGGLEVRQQTALREWVSSERTISPALAQLATAFEERHHDRWWSDFLRARRPQPAVDHLSESIRESERGNYSRAANVAAIAEREFVAAGNVAGELRARRERVLASHRGDGQNACAALVAPLVRRTARLSYRWLWAQAKLDAITCDTLTGTSGSLAAREEALAQIEPMGFEGASLRALAFLTEPWVAADSPRRVWDRGREGLTRYWRSVLPNYRAYHVCWTLSEASRLAGRASSNALLLREAVLSLRQDSNLGLRATASSDLAAAEASRREHGRSASLLREAQALLRGAGAGRPGKYDYEIGIQRAAFELSRGRASESLRQIRSLRATEDRAAPNELDVADLLLVEGRAFLAVRRWGEAEQAFTQVLDSQQKVLRSSSATIERESVLRLYDAARRGLVETQIRAGWPAAVTLESWLNHRADAKPGGASLRLLRERKALLLSYAVLDCGISAWFSDGSDTAQVWIDRTVSVRTAGMLTDLAADASSPVDVVRSAARAAATALTDPLRRQLEKYSGTKVPTLIIDPDEALSALPWALLEDEGGTLLISRFPLIQTCGAVDLRHADHPLGTTSKIAVLADPPVRPEFELPSLSEAIVEGRSVAGMFVRPLLLTAGDVTWAAFQNLASKVEILHFAGHGVSNGGMGALFVSGTPGLITSSDIARLDLSRTQLVVLSSCFSGIGADSDTIHSDVLPKALLDAGVRQVVAASYNTNSLSAQMLMSRFYRTLLSSKNSACALREAILCVIAQRPQVAPHAAAVFRLYGTI